MRGIDQAVASQVDHAPARTRGRHFSEVPHGGVAAEEARVVLVRDGNDLLARRGQRLERNAVRVDLQAAALVLEGVVGIAERGARRVRCAPGSLRRRRSVVPDGRQAIDTSRSRSSMGNRDVAERPVRTQEQPLCIRGQVQRIEDALAQRIRPRQDLRGCAPLGLRGIHAELLAGASDVLRVAEPANLRVVVGHDQRVRLGTEAGRKARGRHRHRARRGCRPANQAPDGRHWRRAWPRVGCAAAACGSRHAPSSSRRRPRAAPGCGGPHGHSGSAGWRRPAGGRPASPPRRDPGRARAARRGPRVPRAARRRGRAPGTPWPDPPGPS